jgi:hypothetical protein
MSGAAVSFSALYSTNVLFRGTLRLSAFVFLSFAAVFSASAGYGLLSLLFQALNSGADFGVAEVFTHSGLTIAFFVLAGLSAYLAKKCYW